MTIFQRELLQLGVCHDLSGVLSKWIFVTVMSAIYVPDVGFERHNKQLAIFASIGPNKKAMLARTGCTKAVPLRLLLAQSLFGSAIAKDLIDVRGVGG